MIANIHCKYSSVEKKNGKQNAVEPTRNVQLEPSRQFFLWEQLDLFTSNLAPARVHSNNLEMK